MAAHDETMVSGFFSIMADETTDKSNREQVVIVIRHVNTELVAH